MDLKICALCEQEFKPSSRHLLCPKCREWRVPCECGGFKYRKSARCAKCVIRIGQAGDTSPNWKGGRIKQQRGYIMRYAPEHPRSTPRTRYVFEHILVMEEFLGRFLVEEENVHHLNGVKDDNRIENLELWVRPQPSGIRMTDAVAWAREILARYEDITPNNIQDED